MAPIERVASVAAAVAVVFSLAGCQANPGGSADSGNRAGSWAAFDKGAGEITQLITGPKGAPYAVGFIGEQEGSLRYRVGKWDGSAWVDVSGEKKETAYAISVYDDGTGPAIHAIINATDYRLCKLGTSGWERLGDKFSATGALLAADLGSGPLLFAGGGSGTFSWWDGKAWTPPFGGFLANEGEPDRAPTVFTTMKKGDAEVLYLGGEFERAGPIGEEVSCSYIVQWDGKTYSPLGKGLGGEDLMEGYVPFVQALCVFEGDLYVGGLFTSAGGKKARGIAKWDGKEWHALGGGVEGTVRAIAAVGGKVYAAGEFTKAGEIETRNIAAWDGEQWTALGAGVDGEVNALLAHEGGLVVGGRFSQAGEISANNVAKWTP